MHLDERVGVPVRRQARIVCLAALSCLSAAEARDAEHVQPIQDTQRTLVIDVDDPRALAAAARQLERQLGVAVTYEDGSYVAAEDIVDVTEHVRRDGRMDQRVLVMRGGPFRVESFLRGGGGPIGARAVLQAVVSRWNTSGNGGEFSVADAGTGVHIVPTSRRGVTGHLEPYTSPLDVRIDMPREERTGLDLVTTIAHLVSEQTGREIWVGMVPTNVMVQNTVTAGAQNEVARAVLWRALQQLHPSLSWQFLCGVGEQASCALNIHTIAHHVTLASTLDGH